jgi:lysophospholipase L1-like esterase
LSSTAQSESIGKARLSLPTLGALLVFAAVVAGAHTLTRGAWGWNPASSWQPIVQFPTGAAAWSPVVQAQRIGVPAALQLHRPPQLTNAANVSWGLVARLTADGQIEAEFLEDANGGLEHFYQALQRADEHPGATVRILHYGDSPTTADLITGDARDILQSRFGNGGPGFLLIAKPWAWYGHNNTELSGDGWKIDTAVSSPKPAPYGLGGAVFVGKPGAVSKIRLLHADATEAELEYLQQPDGGTVTVLADGASAGQVSTSGKEGVVAATTVKIPAGTKSVELSVASGSVKLFGVALDGGKGAGNGGLTYDSLGLNGASTVAMSRSFDAGTWAQALQHRAPDLVIINYGTNESSFPGYVQKQYEPELRRAIARVRAAVPSASILVMSPMDRGERGDGNSIVTMPAIPAIVKIQQRVAADTGCGFFNTFEAMGGEGTMEKWYDDPPRMVAADLIHPTPQGARIVAQHLTEQLLIGYERWVQARAMASQRAAK